MRLIPGFAMDCSDAETVQRLYKSTGRAAISKTEHLVGRFDVAQEIVQEVFLRLWQQKLRFANEKQAYYWVYKSCHNAGIDHLRSASRRLEQKTPAEFFDSLEHARDFQDVSLKRQLVCRLLAGLDERDAQILAYTVIDGMTQEEIAEVLDLSRKTINRACLRLEEKLGKIKEESHAKDA